MSKQVKQELILEGLACANCAAKIEEKVNKLDEVKAASVNFGTRTLTIKSENVDKIDKIVSKIREIVKKIEPHVVVKEKIITRSPRKVLLLMGLDCANCAAKIERRIKKIRRIKLVRVDFVSRKLIIEAEDPRDLDKITNEAIDIVKRIQPDIEFAIKDIEETAGGDVNREESNKTELIRLLTGAIIFGAAVVFKFTGQIAFVLYFLSYILAGGEILLNAAKNVLKGQVFDENFLMSIATIGALAIGEYPEGVAVMLFYQIGEYFQDLAINRSRKSIRALMDLKPDYANLKVGNEIQRVSPEEVNIGDIIVVKPGEKVPLDGEVVKGTSMVDTSALTGESVPRKVEAGSEVLSGFINKNSPLTVKVTKAFKESTVSRILNLVENASSRKAPTEKFITRFARYYTPFVVFTAFFLAIIPPLVIKGAVFSRWIYRALVFLVVSCPCALMVSIPLGFFGGIGGASRMGVLVKGSNFLESLNDVDTVVFDKTGTLTKGVFRVAEIKPVKGKFKDELLEYAAYAESYSNHPIAASILKAYNGKIDKNEIQSYDEISGYGIKAVVKGREVLAGNVKLMKKENIEIKESEAPGTIVYVAVNGEYTGHIVISDEIKEDSKQAIASLKKMGIKKVVMLTGDNTSISERIAKQLGLDEVYAELLPDQKVEKLEMLERQKKSKGRLVFVGDGINDAPVLARADVGIAMGGLGSDAAIEAADVVLMTDEPSKVVTAVKIARRTRRIVWQNIVFALTLKVAVLILGAAGMATMWEAVFADVGVALLAVLNSMRALKKVE